QIERLAEIDVLESQQVLHRFFRRLANGFGAIAFVVDQLDAEVDRDATGVEDLDEGSRHPFVFEVRNEPPSQLLGYRAEGGAFRGDVQLEGVPVGRAATCLGHTASLLCERDVVVQSDSALPGAE